MIIGICTGIPDPDVFVLAGGFIQMVGLNDLLAAQFQYSPGKINPGEKYLKIGGMGDGSDPRY